MSNDDSVKLRVMSTRYRFSKTAKGVRQLFEDHRRCVLVVPLLLLISVCIVGLLKTCRTKAPDDRDRIQVQSSTTEDPMAVKRRIPVQYKERDLVDYNLYHIDVVEQSPVFRFVNRKNTFGDKGRVPKFTSTKPVIFVATPTYTRLQQKAELTNLCSAMRHSTNIFWIVVEDRLQKSELVKQFLIRCGIPAVHMNFKSYYEAAFTIDQRNAVLQWIKRNTNINNASRNSVLYFADDDNTYDPDIFEEMRYTSKVSIWPVGLASEIQAETPILKNGKVVDWVSGYIVNERKFPIDMAGFAISVGFLMDRPLAKFTHDALDGHLESVFLISLGMEDKDFEPRADNCTKVLVWHTQTLQPKTDYFPQTKRGLEIPYWEV